MPYQKLLSPWTDRAGRFSFLKTGTFVLVCIPALLVWIWFMVTLVRDFWKQRRSEYPSLDPDSAAYAPDRIKIGWVLLLVPDTEIDEDDTFP